MPDGATRRAHPSIADAERELRRYANRTGRPPGPGLRVAGALLPGVARVRAQAEPYAAAWTEENERALSSPGRRWVVLGDSMSQSVGASAWHAGWVGQLHHDLARAGHRLAVVNLSASGARVRDVVDQQLPLLDRLPAPTHSPGPDLVTVLVGSNDLFAGRATRRALPEAFEVLVRALPRAAVVATLPQPRTAARRANRHVERAGADGDLEVVDMASEGPRSWRGRLAEDRFHPNDDGYTAIARAFRPHVLEVLAGGWSAP